MIFKILSYLRFLKGSKNQHGIHSPFVYDFITLCLYDKKKYAAYKKIKDYKQLLQQNENEKDLSLTDKKCKLLHRITKYFQAEEIIDLSFSNGLASAAMDIENTTIFCLANSDQKLKSTRIFLSNFDFSHIKLTSEKFEKVLNQLSKNTKKQFFISKNINVNKTKSIFDALLPYITSDSFVILEGIHQSKEKEKLWKEFKNYSKVKVTIDIFFWGIIFFRKKQAKQHFKIRV